MYERRLGYPRNEIARCANHYGVSYAEAEKGLAAGYYTLPPRGTRLALNPTLLEQFNSLSLLQKLLLAAGVIGAVAGAGYLLTKKK